MVLEWCAQQNKMSTAASFPVEDRRRSFDALPWIHRLINAVVFLQLSRWLSGVAKDLSVAASLQHEEKLMALFRAVATRLKT